MREDEVRELEDFGLSVRRAEVDSLGVNIKLHFTNPPEIWPARLENYWEHFPRRDAEICRWGDAKQRDAWFVGFGLG